MVGQEVASESLPSLLSSQHSSSELVIRGMHSRSLFWKVIIISACLLFGSTNILNVAEGSEYVADEENMQIVFASAPEGGFLMNPTNIQSPAPVEDPLPVGNDSKATPVPKAQPAKAQVAKKNTQVASVNKAAPAPRKKTTEILSSAAGNKLCGGAMVWPVAAKTRVSQGFRARHTGLDISYADSANKYLPIVAAADGVVVEAKTSGYNSGYGRVVVIDHQNGYMTRYGHNSKVSVAVGEKVKKGQRIGTMGASGRVYGITGVHVHFEVIKNGKRINPSSCFAK